MIFFFNICIFIEIKQKATIEGKSSRVCTNCYDSLNQKHEISGPTNFSHDSHIGWDPVNGFDINNIPPEWKKLFKEAGVKKSDLENKETAMFLVETIAQNIGTPKPQSGLQRQGIHLFFD